MERTEDYTLNFEAVKTSFRQTKDGYHLTLVIHPNDVQSLPDLVSSWVGTRYQCCLVQLNDENEPVKTKDSEEGNSLVQQAGMLCRSPRFQTWIHNFTNSNEEERDVWGESLEQHTARLLRDYCKIDSRSEFRTNTGARNTFQELYKMYLDHIEEGR